MIDTIVNIFIFVFFDVGEWKGKGKKKLTRGSIKDREYLSTAKEMRVLDVFWKTWNYEFIDGVFDIDTIGNVVIVEEKVSISGDKDTRWRMKVGEGERERVLEEVMV